MKPSSMERDPLAILDAYDFDLPETSIAQTALAQRDAARLLLLDRKTGSLVEANRDHHVCDLPKWLRPNDLLIVNATRVLSARLVGHKSTGGSAEALLLGQEPAGSAADRDGCFRALLKCTGRVRVGLELVLGRTPTVRAQVVGLHDRGEVSLLFEPGSDPYALGEAPLPPYIRRSAGTPGDEDLARYQTIFAREPGAIAAPTAGLHFTPDLFDSLAAQGVERAEVVLHVGAGTFRPLDASALETGLLHSETYELPESTVHAIERARRLGGRVVAVGTTTARVLESCAAEDGSISEQSGETRLFIRPGGEPFRVVDALITNFHLPRSSLLLLVAAFVGREALMAAYEHAIQDGFRFYSYGDAMLIAPDLGASRAA